MDAAEAKPADADTKKLKLKTDDTTPNIYMKVSELYNVPELDHATAKAALADVLAVLELAETKAKLTEAAAPNEENPVRRMHKIVQAEGKIFAQALTKYGFKTPAEANKGLRQTL